MKKRSIFLIGILVGILMCGGIAYAVTLIDSKDVTYTPNDSLFKVNNVKAALDELYDKMQIVRSYTETHYGTSHTPGVTFPVTMTIEPISNANLLILNGHLSGLTNLPLFTVFDVEDGDGNKITQKNNYQGVTANQNSTISASFLKVYEYQANNAYNVKYTAVNNAHSYSGGSVMATLIKVKTPTVKEHVETNFGTSHTPGVTFPVTMTITAPNDSRALIINGHLTGTSGLAYFSSFDVKDSSGNKMIMQYTNQGGVANQNGGVSRSFIYVYNCKPGETYTITYSAVNPSHSYYGGNVMATIY